VKNNEHGGNLWDLSKHPYTITWT